jgi:hypothetical protein
MALAITADLSALSNLSTGSAYQAIRRAYAAPDAVWKLKG